MSDTALGKNRQLLKALALGALVGILLAGFGLFSPVPSSTLQPETIAEVNGVSISQALFDRMISAMTEESSFQVSDERRAEVLDRLIDEELLVQRGLDLGLPQNDRTVRAIMVRNVIDSVVAESQAESVDTKTLRIFLQENSELFVGSPRYRVRVYAAATEEQATVLLDQLIGTQLSESNLLNLDTALLPNIPDLLLPSAKLRDYVGATVLRKLQTLESGEVSESFLYQGRYLVIHLVEQQLSSVPDFELIKDQVENEYRQQRSSEALRDYLSWLKGRATISKDAI